MKKSSKIILYVVLGLVAVGAAVVLLLPEKVETYTVQKGSVEAFVTGTGSIEADTTVTVYAAASGKISDVMFEVGDKVSKGDRLAEYEMDDFSRAYDLARANADYYKDGYASAVYENQKAQTKYAEAAKAAEENQQEYYSLLDRINDLNSSSRNVSVDSAQTLQILTQENANDSQDLARLSEDLVELYADIAELEAQISVLNIELDLGIIVASDADAAEAEIKELEKYRDAKQASIDEKEKKIDRIYKNMEENFDEIASLPVDGMTDDEYALYLELQMQMDKVEKAWSENVSEKSRYDEHKINDSALNQYEDSVEMANIELAKAQEDMELAREGIVADIDGVVVQRYAEAGAFVQEGQPVCEIQPMTGYKASVMISRYDIDSIETGQKADISVGNLNYAATVSRIKDIAEPDNSGKPRVKVEMEIDDKSATPTIGLEANIRIATGHAEDVLIIPDSGWYTDDGGDFAYIIENGKAAKRYFTVKLKGDGYAAIEEGIEEGELVITTAMTDDSIGKAVR